MEKLLQKRLKAFGLLKVKTAIYKGKRVYLAQLMSLPFIAQNLITLAKENDVFHVSSGAIFNFRDTPDDVINDVERKINLVAKEKGFAVKKFPESFVITRTVKNDISELTSAIDEIAKAMRELNKLFSQTESVREECLRKRMSLMFHFE
jgi:hypothetical protein